MIKLREETDNSTITAGDFKGPLPVTHGHIDQVDRKSVRLQKT